MVPGSGTTTHSHTEPLLRARLCAVGLLFSLTAMVFTVRAFAIDRTVSQVVDVLLTGTLAALTLFLYSQLSLSLKQLRIVELAVFGSVALAMAVTDYSLLREAMMQGDLPRTVSASIMSLLHYALLIVAYGMFVPNSWQRASLLVIPLAITPLAIEAVLCFRHPEVRQQAALLGSPDLITDAVLLLMTSVVISLYGTAIISRHRSEAVAAKAMGLYTLKEKIGEGGMGEVWLAQHRMLARPAAIKLIRPEMLGDGNGDSRRLVRRFEREAQATAGLRSPNTVELYDFGVTEDDTFYYVMEYLDGLDLDSLVTRFGPLPPQRAIYLLTQICSSLGDAHNSGLIHRDVKPANIYTCRMGLTRDFVKVLDFGLVKTQTTDDHNTQLTREGLTTGTPAYMAPEMVMGEVEVDSRADIYSLGCVGYWLLTGQLVFDRDTPMAVVVDHVKTSPLPPSERTELEIPAELDRIILKCLEKDPEKRFQTAMQLSMH